MKQAPFWIGGLVVTLFFVGAGCQTDNLPPAENVFATSTTVTSTTSTQPVIPKPTPTVSLIDPFVWDGELPAEKNLAVPFLSQAPKMNWDMPYQEACEEASSIMVDAYTQGRSKAFGPEEGDKAILDLVDYETKLFGKYQDTTAAETAQLIKHYFHYKRVIVREIKDVNELKSVIAHGYPVIVPANGKTLANPNFRNGGPVYHMFVIKGYTKDGHWITNDPGTRKGANFLYTTENLNQSLHDWNGGDVAHGMARAIVIMPN